MTEATMTAMTEAAMTDAPIAAKPKNKTSDMPATGLADTAAARALEITDLCKPLAKAISSVTDYAGKYTIDSKSAYMLFADFELALKNATEDKLVKGIKSGWNSASTSYRTRAKLAGFSVAWPTIGSSGKRTSKTFVFQTIAEKEQQTTEATEKNDQLAREAAVERAVEQANQLKAMSPAQAVEFFKDDIMTWTGGEKAAFEQLVKAMRSTYF